MSVLEFSANHYLCVTQSALIYIHKISSAVQFYDCHCRLYVCCSFFERRLASRLLSVVLFLSPKKNIPFQILRIGNFEVGGSCNILERNIPVFTKIIQSNPRMREYNSEYNVPVKYLNTFPRNTNGQISWHTVTHRSGSEGETGEWSGQPVLFTLPRNMVYPPLLPLMSTSRLPLVD